MFLSREDDEAEEEVAGDESLWCQAKAGQRLSCPKNMNILVSLVMKLSVQIFNYVL